MGELSRGKERLLRRLGDRKGRAREGLVLVEGRRAVGAALAAGARFRFALLARGASAPDQEVAQELDEAGVEVLEVEKQELAEFADTESPQDLLAVAEEPTSELPARRGAVVSGEGFAGDRAPRPTRPADRSLEEASHREIPPGEVGRGEVILVLDAVQDPGNVGTLIRSAVALGADRVLALDGTVDPWNPKVVRSSAGLVFRIPIHRLELARALDWIESRGLALLVADASGIDVRRWLRQVGGEVGEVRPGSGFALVLGNEGAGPRSEAVDRATALVALPLEEGVDSLNVAMAGTLLLWALGPGAGDTPADQPPGDR